VALRHLPTVIDQIEHGHHVFRAYFKSAFLKQYEKFSTFLRNELCSNNLTDFGLKKGQPEPGGGAEPDCTYRRGGRCRTSVQAPCARLPLVVQDPTETTLVRRIKFTMPPGARTEARGAFYALRAAPRSGACAGTADCSVTPTCGGRLGSYPIETA
jgi:hypothetical protein